MEVPGSGSGAFENHAQPTSTDSLTTTLPKTDAGATAKPAPPSSAIQLPVGGGAIRGISEQFKANPVTGTASLSIPLPASPARGFEPELALSYDSGAGNSPFGLGWNVTMPSISRKTDKGLPRYCDEEDSDVYTLTGAEDLVPWLDYTDEQWQPRELESVELNGKQWQRALYRPRVEGAYARIERFREAQTNKIWWRVTSATNVTTVYGFNDDSYICEPDNPARIFRWLADFSYDDKGHVTCYRYQRENADGVDFGVLSEQHRENSAFSQVYIKKVLYGIKESRLKSGLGIGDLFGHTFSDTDFHFQTVFDYGDHADDVYLGQLDGTPWSLRDDPFSNYRAGFEIRTYRRCQRVLLFHDFPSEFARSGVQSADPELVSALELGYEQASQGYSYLTSIVSVGYKRNTDGEMESKRLPAMEYSYQTHQWNNQQQAIDTDRLAHAPIGVDGSQYRWADLYGEGLSGILSEQAGQFHYQHNEGQGHFSNAVAVAPAPSLKGLGTAIQLQDLESNGIKALVASNGTARGYYALQANSDYQVAEWQNFVAFDNMPNIAWDDPNLRIIDLNGDGRADILITEDRALRWYPSAGTKGYSAAESAPPLDEQEAPGIIFASESETIFTADMSGDGLSDIVRIRNGSVVYWPNLGFGRFGRQVTMANAPQFNYLDQFTAGHIRLADLDGSGTTDLVYLGKNEFQYWLNHSGNHWSDVHRTINPFPELDQLSTVSVIDLLGTGTACVVWSSPLPANSGRQLRYVDLLSSNKPHLMSSYKNGFGKTVSFNYTPSTTFYLADKVKGEPWVTRLHFPVHCLSKVDTIDHITGARFTTSYSYHHGYYDHAEREFRGFGRVDQLNTEEYEHFSKNGGSNVQARVLHQTPILTKTWFHNGAYLDQQRILKRYESEYYSADEEDNANIEKFSLAQPRLPEQMDGAEWREALRACKGLVLRTETYGLDGTVLESRPFSVACKTVEIKRVQAKSSGRHAVFQVLDSESVSINLDRDPTDPRVQHTLLLAVNEYGQTLQSATVSYGRKQIGPEAVQAEQQKTHCIVSSQEYTQDDYGPLGTTPAGQGNAISFEGVNRTPVSWRSSMHELGVNWNWSDKLLTASDLLSSFDNAMRVDYIRKDSNDREIVTADIDQLRLLSDNESRFINDAFDGPLAAGVQNPLGIVWKSYQLAFTPALMEAIYQHRLDATSLQGGYVDLHGDGNWWLPSGHALYQGDSSALGVATRFYLAYGSKDALGVCSWTEFDPYLMLPVSSSVSRAGEPEGVFSRINESIAINDYRILSPKFLRDANHNWSAVEVDALGLVERSALMGKVAGTDRNNPPANDALTQGDNLANPGTMFEYRFYDEASNQPAFVHTIKWVKYFSESGETRAGYPKPLSDYPLPIDEYMKTVNQFEYSDGSGNVFVSKQQSTPGMALEFSDDGQFEEVDTAQLSPPRIRWISNGRTVINNAGKPVKQFESYFSITHEFESAAAATEIGESAILFYDAAGRNICKLNPNKSYEKVVFDAWHQQSWDTNDTLYLPQEDGSKLSDIRADPDVGHLFSELSEDEIGPSWYQARISGNQGESADRQAVNLRAAEISEVHVATPTLEHTDSLGRVVLVIAHNRNADKTNPDDYSDEYYSTTSELDIEGNLLSVTDARGNTVMKYRYNLLPAVDEQRPKPFLYQNSMDGGEKWDVYDVQGKPVRSWDSRNHEFENSYDDLNRPLESKVHEASGWKTIGVQIYADDDTANAAELREWNLLGTVYESYDQAGKTLVNRLDFTGNALSASRTLASKYKSTIDWSVGFNEQLEEEIFISTSEYDALSRMIRTESPHTTEMAASVTYPEYNEAGALHRVVAQVRGESATEYVAAIEHNAKGQRVLIQYGNGVVTNYEYEPDTYRLKRLLSKEGNKIWQDLNYCYDSVGNVTAIHDLAQTAQIHGGEQTDGHRQYRYDALYRLIEATGREHPTQAQPASRSGWSRLHDPLDPNVLQNYSQFYFYDSVGNIERLEHRSNRSSNGWTRHYRYTENNNRLQATTLADPGLPFDEPYTYNAHGSMTSNNQVLQMDWDFAEQLRQVSLQGGGEAYYVFDAGGERIRKVIETGTTVKERIYLGGWEVYRERNASGLNLERESLHIMDDLQRVALLETKTVDVNSNSGFASVVRYQLADHLGSSTLEIGQQSANGGAVPLISYEEFHPYGTTAYHFGVENTAFSAKRYRYTGKERDEETGLSYHQARFYSSILVRWISADPDGINDGVNVYRYTSSNPLGLVDPSGRGGAPPAYFNHDDVNESPKMSFNPADSIPDPGLWFESRMKYVFTHITGYQFDAEESAVPIAESEHSAPAQRQDTPSNMTDDEVRAILEEQGRCVPCFLPPEVELENKLFLRAYAFRAKEVKIGNPLSLLTEHPRGPKLFEFGEIGAVKVKTPLFGWKHTFTWSDSSDLVNNLDYDIDYYTTEDTYVSAKTTLPRIGEIEGRLYPLDGVLKDGFDPLRKGKVLWNPMGWKSKPKLGSYPLDQKFQFTLDWAEGGEYGAVGFRRVYEYKGPWGFGFEANAGASFDMGVMPRGSYCRNQCHAGQSQK